MRPHPAAHPISLLLGSTPPPPPPGCHTERTLYSVRWDKPSVQDRLLNNLARTVPFRDAHKNRSSTRKNPRLNAREELYPFLLHANSDPNRYLLFTWRVHQFVSSPISFTTTTRTETQNKDTKPQKGKNETKPGNTLTSAYRLINHFLNFKILITWCVTWQDLFVKSRDWSNFHSVLEV